MKIAQVCPYDFTRHGGVKTHILQLAEALKSRGHEVKIIAPRTSELTSEGSEFFFGKNYSVGFGGTKIDVNACLGDERKRLIQFLKEEQFDVIHFHTIWNPFLPLQVLRHSNSRNIGTFHDTPGKGFIPQLLGRLAMPVMARFIFRKLQGIISVSTSQAKYISGMSKREINIIPNGILFPSTPAQPISKYKDGLFNILFLGRLEPRKGLFDALEAIRKIQDTDDTIRLIVAGDGDQMQEALEFVEKHKLKNVEFLGKVSDQEKWALLATTDIYLAPAKYGESFGIVLLEAMAAAVPIVGYANEGYVNVINTQQAEFFASPSNVEELTAVLKSLIESEEKRIELIQFGLEEVRKYDWKLLVQEIEKVYGK